MVLMQSFDDVYCIQSIDCGLSIILLIKGLLLCCSGCYMHWVRACVCVLIMNENLFIDIYKFRFIFLFFSFPPHYILDIVVMCEFAKCSITMTMMIGCMSDEVRSVRCKDKLVWNLFVCLFRFCVLFCDLIFKRKQQ